jgi:predicted chitinase
LGQQCNRQENADISLPDLGAHYGRPEGDCCGICQNTPGCQAYAWNNHEGGTCWLKAGTGPINFNPGVTVGTLGDGNPGDGLVTYDEFAAAVTGNGFPQPSQQQYQVFVNSAGPKGQITNKQEAAMAIVHFMHESDGLRAKREYACIETGCPGSYETPGCDADGQDYYGRGYIQLSWCYNYRPASQYLFGDDRLVWDADMVARDENTAWDTAFWFWMANVHNAPGVQEGRFGASTRAINGGLECDGPNQHIARHRYEMYKIVRRAFGILGDGDERGCYN